MLRILMRQFNNMRHEYEDLNELSIENMIIEKCNESYFLGN